MSGAIRNAPRARRVRLESPPAAFWATAAKSAGVVPAGNSPDVVRGAKAQASASSGPGRLRAGRARRGRRPRPTSATRPRVRVRLLSGHLSPGGIPPVARGVDQKRVRKRDRPGPGNDHAHPLRGSWGPRTSLSPRDRGGRRRRGRGRRSASFMPTSTTTQLSLSWYQLGSRRSGSSADTPSLRAEFIETRDPLSSFSMGCRSTCTPFTITRTSLDRDRGRARDDAIFRVIFGFSLIAMAGLRSG